MGGSCEINSHFINVVAASLRRGASAVALDSTATQRRGYSAYGFIRRFLPFENRFQGKVRIEMIGREPVAIEER
jgi:hypothetical protein